MGVDRGEGGAIKSGCRREPVAPAQTRQPVTRRPPLLTNKGTKLMSQSPKVRPTLSLRDLAIIANTLDAKIRADIDSGNPNHSLALDMMRIKQYLDTFQPKTNNAEALLAAYLKASHAAQTGQAPSSQSATIDPMILEAAVNQISDNVPVMTTEEILTAPSTSPIDNPALTDDQRYDLLALVPDKKRTPAETKWFLEKGTLILFRRNGINGLVSEGDL